MLTQDFSRINQYRLPPYDRLDLAAIYTPKQRITKKLHSSWVFSIYNVYSRLNPYFIYFENGVTVSMGGSKSCSSFCGYHDAIGSSTYYAVMPYPSCAGCLGSSSVKDALTGTSSHELCEAITDPVPGTGWYDDHNGEIGDICAWQFKTVNGYNVQLEWSNKNNKCI